MKKRAPCRRPAKLRFNYWGWWREGRPHLADCWVVTCGKASPLKGELQGLSHSVHGLRLVGGAAVALGYYFAGVFVEGAGLRDGLHGLLYLRISFQENLETFRSAVIGHEDFLLNLAFHPIEILGVFRLGVMNVVLAEVVAELVENFVVDLEAVANGGPGAEEVAGEAANALFGREEDVIAKQQFLELGGLGGIDNDVGRDATATGYGAATIRLANLCWMLGNFALVVIFVQRDGFVIALNQAAARRVVTSSGKRQAGVFCERRDGLDQALAESCFTNDQAAIVILHSAGDDLRGGGGVVIHDDHERHGHALVAAYCVERTIGGVAAVIGDNELTLFEEHVADSHSFVEQAAGISAKIENQAVKGSGAEILESVSNFTVGGFVELR